MEADQRGTTNWFHIPSEQGRCKTSPFHISHSLQQGCNSVRTVFWQVIRCHNDEYSTWAFPFHVRKECQPKSKVDSPRWVSIENSLAARTEYDEIGAFVFCIPPHRPDLNLIEYIFRLVNMEIRKDTTKRNITEETLISFSQRVNSLVQKIPKRTINHVIDIMDNGIKTALRARGNRIK